jgi:hypothetical protein
MNFSWYYNPIGNHRSGTIVSLIVFKDSRAKTDFLRHEPRRSQQRARVSLPASFNTRDDMPSLRTWWRTSVLSAASVIDVTKRRCIYRAHVSTIPGTFNTKTSHPRNWKWKFKFPRHRNLTTRILPVRLRFLYRYAMFGLVCTMPYQSSVENIVKWAPEFKTFTRYELLSNRGEWNGQVYERVRKDKKCMQNLSRKTQKEATIVTIRRRWKDVVGKYYKKTKHPSNACFTSVSYLRLSVGHLGQGSVRRRTATYTQTQNKRRQTFMPWMGFEPTITVLERVKLFHDLDSATTVMI